MTVPIRREHFLPANATKIEIDLSETGGRIDDIPVPIDTLWSWDKCPVSHLPWLAWALSVDFWNQDWSESRKRQVIREAFDVHRIKGTIDGVRKYIEYADCEALRFITPPQTPYWGRSQTKEERQAYLDNFAQLRIYPYAEKSIAPKTKWFWGKSCYGNDFLVKSTAIAQSSQTATIWDKGSHLLATGQETKTRHVQLNRQGHYQDVLDFEHVHVPGKAAKGAFFYGHSPYKSFYGPIKDTPSRSFTIKHPSKGYKQTSVIDVATLSPSLEPVSRDPEYVAERSVASPVKWFWGKSCYGNAYLTKSTAHKRLYRKYYLFDKQRVGNKGKGRMFWGHFRWGMPAYQAEILVKIRSQKIRGSFFYGHSPYKSVWHKSDQSKLDNCLRAVRSAKAARDKILIDTKTTRPRTWGDGVPLNGEQQWRQTAVPVLK